MEHLKRRGPAPQVLAGVNCGLGALIDLSLRIHCLPYERTCEKNRQPAAPVRDEIPISRSIEAMQVTSLLTHVINEAREILAPPARELKRERSKSELSLVVVPMVLCTLSPCSSLPHRPGS